MDAGLGSWTPNDADGLARSFAGSSIGLRTLATDRQAAQVAHAAITLDSLQPFKVHTDLAAQIALDDIFAILDRMHDLRKLLLSEILGADAGIDFCLFKHNLGVGRANAIN